MPGVPARRKPVSIFVLFAALVVVAAAIVFVLVRAENKSDVAASDVTTYQQCLETDDSTQTQTFPEQCVTSDGKSFTNTESTPTPAPTPAPKVANPNFDACVKAPGSTVLLTSPEQCRTAGGQTYVKDNGEL